MLQLLKILVRDPNDLGFVIGLVLVTIGATIERTSAGFLVPGAILLVASSLPYLRRGK